MSVSISHFAARLPVLLQPLAGSTRFFGQSPFALPVARVLLQFVIFAALAAGLLLAADVFARWYSADLRALLPSPRAEALLASPWSELATWVGYLLVWTLYLLIFSALRFAMARFINDSSGNWSLHFVYACFALVPVILCTVFINGLRLFWLPANAYDAALPMPAAGWLPLILFVAGFLAEAWLVSRALVLRHAATVGQAVLIFVTPWMVFFTLFLLLYGAVSLYYST